MAMPGGQGGIVVWTLHWRETGDSQLRLKVFTSREESLLAAKQAQSDPSVTITKISGPNGEILTAEKIFQLIAGSE